MNQSSCIFEVISQTVSSSGNRLSVKELCRTAGVSRSGYYAWVKAAPARAAAEERDRRDFELILEAYQVRGYKKGAESIYLNLIHRNPPVVMNLKKIRRLMKKFGLVCPIRNTKEIDLNYIQSVLSLGDAQKGKTELRPLLGVRDFFRKIIVTKSGMKPWIDEEGILHLGLYEFLLNPAALDL